VPKRRERGSRSGNNRTRGASKYRHPVPESTAILQTLESRGVPVGFDDLAEALGVSGERPLRALRRDLKTLADSGRLMINRKKEYCLLEKIDAVSGVVSAHADGFGFLIPDTGDTDIYLPYHEMRLLLDGDRVVVRVDGTWRGGKPSGSVVEILERGKQTAVGHYQREHGVGFVVESGRSPHHFIVPNHHRNGAKPGELVKLEIIEYPSRDREAQGKVVKVLGDQNDPGMLTEVAIEQFELPTEWSAAVLESTKSFGDEVREADKAGREDLRELPLVTIDGADARDFDDAVYATPSGDGWRLIVAIADVSHYVRRGEPLDEEARNRGTSVYFTDRVVPMLPESLSNGLCSLNPGVDRLCVVCDMSISANGEVKSSRFYRGVMRSAARLTYEEVDHIKQTGPQSEKHRELLPQIDGLYGVYRALLGARRQRGALDLELPEVVIELNQGGQISRIVPRSRNDAHRLIEECMVAANVEAAKFLRQHKLPTLYRVHERPEPDRFEVMRVLMQALGIKVTDQARTDPKQMNQVLQQLRDRPDYAVLAVAVLRSLSQAVYQPGNAGHFGLGLTAYAHFTSPIRRYPDLQVHRGIGYLLDGGKPAAYAETLPSMEASGSRCSMLERRAEEATRYVEARFKCAYMLDHIGEVLPGVVTGVTHFGLFVTLGDLFIEGLVHVTSLGNDYYHSEHGGLRLTGERTGTSYGLGDAVEVRVLRVDVDEAKIDLALADIEPTERKRKSKSKRRRS
jgi:ribonuclease R